MNIHVHVHIWYAYFFGQAVSHDMDTGHLVTSVCPSDPG